MSKGQGTRQKLLSNLCKGSRKKGWVTTDDGRTFKLAPRQETGLIPCPGEAHIRIFLVTLA